MRFYFNYHHSLFPEGGAFAGEQPQTFQPQTLPKPEPLGPHSRGWESQPPEEDSSTSSFYPSRNSPELPVPASSAESASFRSEISGVANPLIAHLSSFHISPLGSSTQFHLLEQGSAHPQCLERVPGHLSSYAGTCLNELKLNSNSQDSQESHNPRPLKTSSNLASE